MPTIKVSDEEVRQEIQRLFSERKEVFPNGDQYQLLIRRFFREEPREFEEQVRVQLRIQKLIAQVRKNFKKDPDKRLKRWFTKLMTHANVKFYPPQS